MKLIVELGDDSPPFTLADTSDFTPDGIGRILRDVIGLVDLPYIGPSVTVGSKVEWFDQLRRPQNG